MKNRNIWILCPNLRGARLFNYFLREEGSYIGPEEGPTFLEELPRPEVMLRDEDFDTDADIPELTQRASDLLRKERVARNYALTLSRHLELACKDQKFDSLILCAEGHFRRHIEERLGPCTVPKLIGTVDLDLYHINETDLFDYVQDILLQTYKRPARRAA